MASGTWELRTNAVPEFFGAHWNPGTFGTSLSYGERGQFSLAIPRNEVVLYLDGSPTPVNPASIPGFNITQIDAIFGNGFGLSTRPVFFRGMHTPNLAWVGTLHSYALNPGVNYFNQMTHGFILDEVFNLPEDSPGITFNWDLTAGNFPNSFRVDYGPYILSGTYHIVDDYANKGPWVIRANNNSNRIGSSFPSPDWMAVVGRENLATGSKLRSTVVNWHEVEYLENAPAMSWENARMVFGQDQTPPTIEIDGQLYSPFNLPRGFSITEITLNQTNQYSGITQNTFPSVGGFAKIGIGGNVTNDDWAIYGNAIGTIATKANPSIGLPLSPAQTTRFCLYCTFESSYGYAGQASPNASPGFLVFCGDPGFAWITGDYDILPVEDIEWEMWGGLNLGGTAEVKILSDASGLYTLIPGKRNDTLIRRGSGGAGNPETVKIPNPFIETAFFGK